VTCYNTWNDEVIIDIFEGRIGLSHLGATALVLVAGVLSGIDLSRSFVAPLSICCLRY